MERQMEKGNFMFSNSYGVSLCRRCLSFSRSEKIVQVLVIFTFRIDEGSDFFIMVRSSPLLKCLFSFFIGVW